MPEILGANGKPAEPAQAEAQQPAPEQAEAATGPQLPDGPALAIDQFGNMTLFVPLQKTNEIFARGMIDVARSKVLTWYANQTQQKKIVEAHMQKQGFKGFVQNILRRK